MTWGATAVAGASLVSGFMGKKSAKKAIGAQEQATAAALAEQRRQYDQSRTDSAPWREAGTQGVSRLSQLLGLGTAGGEGFGSANRKFTVADFMDDPVTKLSYQSGIDLGKQAIDRMAGARGSRNSGSTLKALSRFGTDYTGQKAGESYNRFYGDQDRELNRLAGIAGTGQTAVTNQNALGSQTATNIGNLVSSLGNARGASAIAQGNIWGGAAQNIGNWYGQNQMLDKILASQKNYGPSGGYYDDVGQKY